MRKVDSPTDIESELIASEGRFALVVTGRLSGRAEIKEVARIQCIVAQKFKELAVIIVGARPRRDIHDRS